MTNFEIIPKGKGGLFPDYLLYSSYMIVGSERLILVSQATLDFLRLSLLSLTISGYLCLSLAISGISEYL